jgi:hypothetical protein
MLFLSLDSGIKKKTKIEETGQMGEERELTGGGSERAFKNPGTSEAGEDGSHDGSS